MQVGEKTFERKEVVEAVLDGDAKEKRKKGKPNERKGKEEDRRAANFGEGVQRKREKPRKR